MEEYKKKEMLKTVSLLGKMNTLIAQKKLGKGTADRRKYLIKCQNIAIDLGNTLENRGKTEAVSILEDYCENIYLMNVNDSDTIRLNEISEEISKQLNRLKNYIKDNLPDDKKEIVFLPYNASMWDSLESVWKAASKDAECITYVVPIPYYDKNPDGSFGEMHYEGDRYPDYVPITSWQQYDLKKHRPDIAYIHNPYDDWNYVTSVHPDYFIRELKKYVDRVVYIPYFVGLNNVVASHFCALPGTLFSDKVIVQSEEVKKIYIEAIKKYEEENDCRGVAGNIEEKISGLGSPKYDSISDCRIETDRLPKPWRNIIYGPENKRKKIILYNTSIQSILVYKERMLQKISETLKIFQKYRNKIVLLWRPHPLIPATLQAMHPELWKDYSSIVMQYKEEQWGIYDDTAELNRAITISDAYYGDSSSLLELYQQTGKRFYKQWIDTTMADSGSNILLQCCCNTPVGTFAFSRVNNALFRVIHNNKLQYIGTAPGELKWKKMLYADIACCGDKIYLAPEKAKKILIYDYVQNVFSEAELKFPKIRQKFKKVYIENGKVFFIPEEYPYIVCLDAETGETEQVEIGENLLKKHSTCEEYRMPSVEDTKLAIYVSSYGNSNMFIVYDKELGIYNDPEAMMVQTDLSGNIISRKKYSVENVADYHNAVSNATEMILKRIFKVVLRSTQEETKLKSNVGQAIHNMIIEEYANEIS